MYTDWALLATDVESDITDGESRSSDKADMFDETDMDPTDAEEKNCGPEDGLAAVPGLYPA